MTATLNVEILGDSRKARSAIDSTSSSLGDLDKSASRTSSSIGDSFDGVGKAVLAFGAAAAVGIGVLAVGAFQAAEESAKIGRETERVIKTTGAAAWTSAQQVADLAGSLSEVTGVDDELIQSNENLLLTFTNVKDVVGDGNDVFSQATALSLDMATALGTDASSAAIQLGKALNDPTKGLTALSKAGVSFTEDQKKQIKTLQESGDILGAQKIVLQELAKEFGGAAAAAATPLDHLKVLVGNLQEAIGAKLIPVVDAVASWLADKIPAALAVVMPMLEEFSGWFTDHITPALKRLGDIGKNAFDWAKDNKGVLTTIGTIIGVGLAAAVYSLATAFGTLAASVIGATAPVLLIGAAIGILVALFRFAYENNTDFRNAVDTTFQWLKDNVPPILDKIKAAFETAFNWIKDNGAPILEGFRSAAETAFNWLRDHIPPIVETVRAAAETAFTWLRDHIPPLVETVRASVETAFNWLHEHIPPIAEGIRADVETAFNWLRDNIPTAVEKVRAAVETAFFWMRDNVGPILDTLKSKLESAFSGENVATAVGKIQAAFASLQANAPSVLESVGSGFQTAFGWLSEHGAPILDAIRGAAIAAFGWITATLIPKLTSGFESFKGFLDNTFFPAVRNIAIVFAFVFGLIITIVRPIIDFIVGFVQDNFGHIAEIVSIVFDVIKNVVANVWQIISNMFQFWLNIIALNWGGAWDNIKNVFSAVWDIIQNIGANAFGILRELIQTFLALVGSLAGRILEGLGALAGLALGFLDGIWHGILDTFGRIFEFIGGVDDQIASLAHGMWDGIWNAFKAVINLIIRGWNALKFEIPPFDFGPAHFGGFTLGMPTIPQLATGGIIARPTFALVGEAGPEAVIPLDRLGATAGTVTHIHVTVNHAGLGVDSPALQRDVVATLSRWVKRNGPVPGLTSV
jgi:phage-related protein